MVSNVTGRLAGRRVVFAGLLAHASARGGAVRRLDRHAAARRLPRVRRGRPHADAARHGAALRGRERSRPGSARCARAATTRRRCSRASASCTCWASRFVGPRCSAKTPGGGAPRCRRYPFQRESVLASCSSPREEPRLARTDSPRPSTAGRRRDQPAAHLPERDWRSVSSRGWRITASSTSRCSPPTGFLELAMAAAREVLDGDAVVLRDLVIREGLRLPDDEHGDGAGDRDAGGRRPPCRFKCSAVPLTPPSEAAAAAWRLHASAIGIARRALRSARPRDIAALKRAAASEMAVEPYYERLAAQGGHYGPIVPRHHVDRSRRERRARSRGARWRRGRRRVRAADSSRTARRLLPTGRRGAAVGAVLSGRRRRFLRARRHGRLPRAAPRRRGRLVPRDHRTRRERCAGLSRRRDAAGRRGRGASPRCESWSCAGRHATCCGARSKETRVADWAYEVDWPLSPLPAAATNDGSGRWLVFADAGGVGSRLARQLEARGDTVVEVYAGADVHTRCSRSASSIRETPNSSVVCWPRRRSAIPVR